MLHTEANGDVLREKIPTLQGNYYDYFDGVYQSLANGAAEPVSAQDGINVMQIIEAAAESNQLKKVINL